MGVLSAMRMEGAAALVTGASRGLGKGSALALAEAGADLALCATGSSALEETAEAVRTAGRRAEVYSFDVSDPDASREAVDRAARDLGRLDIAVNAAGICPRAASLETRDEELHKTFAVNVYGTFYVCTAAVPHMRKPEVQKSGGGRVVNFGSVAGIRARPNVPVYGASKAAVQSLTQSLAVEFAPLGIRVNAVLPGQFDTDMGAPLMNDPEALAAYVKRMPLGRVGRAEEVPALVVYLCSPASSYVTGSLVVVDGGVSLQ